jgi:hypothetical protein
VRLHCRTEREFREIWGKCVSIYVAPIEL